MVEPDREEYGPLMHRSHDFMAKGSSSDYKKTLIFCIVYRCLNDSS